MADLGVAHLPRRQADRLARRGERRVRVLRPQPVEDRRVGEVDGVARARRGAAPAVEDDERDEREGLHHAAAAAASQIAANDSTWSEAPPTSAPSTSGLRHQLGRVLGLHRAAVEHRPVEQRLHEGVRLLRQLRRRGPAGADRPDRLVGEHEPLVRTARVADRVHLDAQDGLHLARRRAAPASRRRRRSRRGRRRAPPSRGARHPRRSRRSTAAARSGRRASRRRRARAASAPRSRPCTRPPAPSGRSARTSSGRPARTPRAR